ncbi:MAG TPA: hypothetical protein DCG78_05030 [Anaerolineaceae bacterium]|nr:hypothetical protein [Anaerolineaceae bacterium]
MTENSQNTQPIKAETQEETQPIKTKPETRLPSQSDQTPEQIQMEAAVPVQNAPEWLIEFASQKGSSATPISVEEDTREIKVNPDIESPLPQADTQPIRTAPAASTVASAWSSETIPSSPTDQEQGGTSAKEPTEPLELQTTSSQEVPFREAFTEALDTQQYTHALELLEHYRHDAATRSEALRILRSRLTLKPTSRPLWEIYAKLNAQENQPALADKAQQIADYLSHLEEE